MRWFGDLEWGCKEDKRGEILYVKRELLGEFGVVGCGKVIGVFELIWEYVFEDEEDGVVIDKLVVFIRWCEFVYVYWIDCDKNVDVNFGKDLIGLEYFKK